MGQATPPDDVIGILETATGIAAGAEHTLAIVGGGGPAKGGTVTLSANGKKIGDYL